jgi:hypothetical protein
MEEVLLIYNNLEEVLEVMVLVEEYKDNIYMDEIVPY